MTTQKLIYRRPNRASSLTMAPSRAGQSLHCDHRRQACGACEFVNLSYEEGLERKYRQGIELLSENDFLKDANVIAPLGSPRTLGYRAHVKYVVKSVGPENLIEGGDAPDAGLPRIALGLYKPGTHDLIEPGACPIQMPAINRLIAELPQLIAAQTDLPPYDEATHTGVLRYVCIRSAHLTDTLMVTFVTTVDCRKTIKSLVQSLRNQGHKIVSVYMNINPDRNNKIFGDESILIHGTERLREGICDLGFEIGPTSFFQINPWMAEVIYRRIEQIVGPGSSKSVAWDFYCGIGQITMMLARQGYKVLGIEANSQAIIDARNNLNINELSSRVEFITGKTEEVTSEIPNWASNPELIVCNPSRHGIHPATLDHIAMTMRQRPHSRFVYMSCDVHSLKRDLKMLCSDQRFRLRQVEAFDMFPFTDKLEWLVVVTCA